MDLKQGCLGKMLSPFTLFQIRFVVDISIPPFTHSDYIFNTALNQVEDVQQGPAFMRFDVLGRKIFLICYSPVCGIQIRHQTVMVDIRIRTGRIIRLTRETAHQLLNPGNAMFPLLQLQLPLFPIL